MAEAYVGEIRLFAGNYAPEGWFPCDGRQLNVSQYEVLFATIGFLYGGDGSAKFNLPNLVGRLPIGSGQGPGLSKYLLGQADGSETVALDVSELPTHGHGFNVANLPATATNPSPSVTFANAPASTSFYIDTAQPTVSPPLNFSAKAVSYSGSGGAHANTMPSMSLMYIICAMGVFPN
jgi:microcystin-dependent protein